MADTVQQTYRPFLEAISFAARAHRHHLRKDRETPYVSHVFRVCLIVRHIFGIEEPTALMAAVLHDTVEDTTTDYDDLEKHFSTEVADWVAILSKDKRQRDEPREAAYMAGLARAPWQVKVCKMADVFDNLLDSAHMGPEAQARTCKRSHAYLDAVNSPDLPPPARRAWDLVARLLAEMQGT